MIPDENLLCDMEPTPNSQQELRRIQVLDTLGLLEPGSVPIFEEATQTAAHFLNAPICVLSILDRDRVWFKSAVGLSRIGLMNSLATSRQLPRQDAFCTQVVENQRMLLITDAEANPQIAPMVLVQRYGIRAYLGVPLLTTNGHCIGTLAVMGLAPRSFSEQEMAFLELLARWSMSEFERCRIQQQSHLKSQAVSASTSKVAPVTEVLAASVKTDLLSQMTQELCTPLTSILGMAKVLNQGIYGSLSNKQQEYIQVIHNSGQYLLSLVNEIVDLGALDDQNPQLTLCATDIEMLCQQTIASLNQVALRREQQIQLTVEPGNRIWLLDKEKVRQMLYHLVFSVIQSSNSDSITRIHVSRKQNALHLSVWSSHPWLGEGLPQVDSPQRVLAGWTLPDAGSDALMRSSWTAEDEWSSIEPANPSLINSIAGSPDATRDDDSRLSLGLKLSRQLAALHAGEIVLQGSAAEGYRYVIRLPQMKGREEQTSAQRP
jgi:signal transduction histidine kinase